MKVTEDVLIVRSVDEVASSVIVRVEELHTAFLVHRAHTVGGPLVSDAHRTELDGRDVYTSVGVKLSVIAQLGLGRRRL